MLAHQPIIRGLAFLRFTDHKQDVFSLESRFVEHLSMSRGDLSKAKQVRTDQQT